MTQPINNRVENVEMESRNEYSNRFFVPVNLANNAIEMAFKEIERRTGFAIKPDIRLALLKCLQTMTSQLEIKGGALTHKGFEKQVKNEAEVKAALRKAKRRHSTLQRLING